MPALQALFITLWFAQQNPLSGTITYKSGSAPASQVKVVAQSASGDSIVYTDSDGRYSLPARPTTITVERTGCETILRKIGASESRVDLQLSKERKPGRGVRCCGGAHVTVIEVRTEPDYPAELRDQGIEGDVMLMGIIGKDGMVRNLQAADMRQPHQGLVNAALRAVKNWRFRPSYIDCEPIEVFAAPISVSFSSKSTTR